MTLPLLALLAGAFDLLSEPLLYHDPARTGFTSRFLAGRPPRQASFALRELPDRPAAAQPAMKDAYIAQNEFFKPDRRLSSLSHLTSFYVDIDTYKLPKLQPLPPERLAELVLQACARAGVPEPTVIAYSGRGLQIKWVLTTPVPARALPRWKALRSHLCACLETLNADTNALDAARVLRLVGSINSKSGEVVRIVHLAYAPSLLARLRADGVVTYDFETFADAVLPLSRAELDAARTERQAQLEQQARDREAAACRRQAMRDRLVMLDGGRAAPSDKTRHGIRRLVASELAMPRLGDLRRLAALRLARRNSVR